MFPICLQLAAGKTWQSLIYTVYTYELMFIYTIKTMGVNKTTIAYLRVLIIETGSTIILMVVEPQGIHILFKYNYHHYYVVVTYIYNTHITFFSMLTKNYVHTHTHMSFDIRRFNDIYVG